MKPGEYHLLGVREVASGFQFNADKTFNFYFVYGALDRLASGTWEQQGDKLILNSPRKPDNDFMLVKSRKTSGRTVTIQVKDPNTIMLNPIYCEIQTPNGPLQAQSDSAGRIPFETASVQSIALIHGYWPDRYSRFEVTTPSANYFEFTIAPHIMDVEFHDLTLTITGKDLVGMHPLLDADDLRYVRAER